MKVMGLRDLLSSLYGMIRFKYLRYKEIRKYGNYYFPYRDLLNAETVYVLANGPSLKDELTKLIDSDNFNRSHKFALNFFSLSDVFTTVRPDFYCLADKGFFINYSTDRHKRTIEKLNELTTWKLKLFVPNVYYSIIVKLINNSNIELIPITILQFDGFERRKYEYYKKGWAVPSFVNVTIMIEYILLNLGCKDIRLYGVDHTFFDGMTVNDNNIPCIIDRHFDTVELRPLYKFDGGYYSLAGWLWDKYLTFKEHENMRNYADYLGAQIINCTKCSLIDAYIRISQFENQNK